MRWDLFIAPRNKCPGRRGTPRSSRRSRRRGGAAKGRRLLRHPARRLAGRLAVAPAADVRLGVVLRPVGEGVEVRESAAADGTRGPHGARPSDRMCLRAADVPPALGRRGPPRGPGRVVSRLRRRPSAGSSPWPIRRGGSIRTSRPSMPSGMNGATTASGRATACSSPSIRPSSSSSRPRSGAASRRGNEWPATRRGRDRAVAAGGGLAEGDPRERLLGAGLACSSRVHRYLAGDGETDDLGLPLDGVDEPVARRDSFSQVEEDIRVDENGAGHEGSGVACAEGAAHGEDLVGGRGEDPDALATRRSGTVWSRRARARDTRSS